MNQIINDSVSAFCEGRRFKRSNMQIDVIGPNVLMWQHGNLIASRDGDLYSTVIGNAGWYTVTTKARLDALLQRVTMGAWSIAGRNAPPGYVGEWTLYSRKHGEHLPFTGCIDIETLIELDDTIAKEKEVRNG